MSAVLTCLFCESNNVKPSNRLPIHFNETIFTWHVCKNCALLFLQPDLNDKDKQKMYGTSYHSEYYFNYTENYSKQLRLMAPFEKTTFLDFGCGDAGLISLLQKNKYKVCGVEFNEGLIKILKEKFSGITFIQEKDFWDTTETFDIIHLGDVLEHVSNPVGLIQKLRGRLNPGGIFFIEGPMECNPNAGYYFRKITYAIKKAINKESVRVKVPYHITYSNKKNQQLFFKKLGLQQLLFTIDEKGWPYIGTLQEIKSPGLLFQYVIAKISILISFLVPGWGNRFTYIGRPDTH